MRTPTSRTALITGASGGIGKAVAKRLAKDGFDIVVHYAGNPAKAEELVAEIKQGDGKAVAIKADVAVAAEVENLFKSSLEQFGHIDVVVHLAGIMPLFPISGGDVESFDKVISTNLRGTFLVLSQAAQHMTSGGRIMAFSSSVLAKSFPNYGAYIASKAGVEGLVHVLANELRGRNITVNAVAPGPTGTDLFLTGKGEELIKELANLAPLQRLGTPKTSQASCRSLPDQTADGSTRRYCVQTAASLKTFSCQANSVRHYIGVFMRKIIIITGASSGFGALTARALAKAGHCVFASMRDTAGRNAPQVVAAAKFAKENKVDLRTIELNVASQDRPMQQSRRSLANTTDSTL